MKIIKSIIEAGIFLSLAIIISVSLSGCSGGATGLISITPEQYLASAKETSKTIDQTKRAPLKLRKQFSKRG